jgi:hypothetical protein
MRSTGRYYWLRVPKKNGEEYWHEIPSWLWFEIIHARSERSTLPDAPVFSSPRHPNRFYSCQELNRKLRRYAQLAGVQTNVRVQDLRGILMENEGPKNGAEYLAAKPNSTSHINRDYRLHGIGRRSFARQTGG